MMDVDALREDFYWTIADCQNTGLHSDAATLASKWAKVTGSICALLWLRNENANRWELFGQYPETIPHDPAQTTFKAGNSMGDCAVESGEPILKHRIDGPDYVYNGKTFRPQFKETLLRHGVHWLDIVPLRSVVSLPKAEGLDLKVVGMVALHYPDDQARVEHPESSYRKMGWMTSDFLIKSILRRQSSVLVELNELQAEYLPKVGQPGEVRAQYAAKLVKLISDRLHCRSVSVFHERRWSDRAFCIATTGLVHRETGRRIEPEECLEVSYHLDKSTWTGECIRTGELRIRVRGAATNHQGLFREATDQDDLLLVPIPRVDGMNQDATDAPKACGAIRCAGHESPDHAARDFNALDIQVAQFMARQIAPVLETFASRIEREDAVSVLKHDMDSPLNMIQSTLMDIKKIPLDEKLSEEKREYLVRHYDLKDMLYSVHACSTLVAQLTADPHAVRELKPTKVYLEGDIIAALVSLLNHFAAFRNISITYGLFRGSPDGKTPPIPPVWVDRELIERVFSNLLSNAIKYGTMKSEIHIEPRVEIDEKGRDGLHVWISNHGIGISEAESKRLFEPYYRGEAAKQTAVGAGLGLSIAQAIMKAHKGEILLKQRGGGKDPTIFDVWFPRSTFK